MGCRRVLMIGEHEIEKGFLEGQGFEVRAALDPSSIARLLSDFRCDCVAVFLGRSTTDFKLLSCIRLLADAPVLALSANRAEDIVCDALSVADMLLPLPTTEWLLCSTVRALIRRPPRTNVVRCFGIEIDPVSRAAFIDGRPLRLPRIEYEMLRTLVKANGRAVSKMELQYAVWGNNIPADGTFKTHIHRLRKAIGSDRLVTICGIGYALQWGNRDLQCP